jgi:hypothetical protein
MTKYFSFYEFNAGSFETLNLSIFPKVLFLSLSLSFSDEVFIYIFLNDVKCVEEENKAKAAAATIFFSKRFSNDLLNFSKFIASY